MSPISLMSRSLFPFVSRLFMIACWSICIMTALKPSSSHFSVYVIWALAFVDWFFPRELRTLWLLVCWVVLDLILSVLNSILIRPRVVELRWNIFVLAVNQSGYSPVASSHLPSVDSASTLSSVSKPLCLHRPGGQSKSMSCGVSAGLFLSARYVISIGPRQAQLGCEHRNHSSHFSETLLCLRHFVFAWGSPSPPFV